MKLFPAGEFLAQNILDVTYVFEVRRVESQTDVVGLHEVAACGPHGLQDDIGIELDGSVDNLLCYEEDDLQELILVLFHNRLPHAREFIDGIPEGVEKGFDLLDRHLPPFSLAFINTLVIGLHLDGLFLGLCLFDDLLGLYTGLLDLAAFSPGPHVLDGIRCYGAAFVLRALEYLRRGHPHHPFRLRSFLRPRAFSRHAR